VEGKDRAGREGLSWKGRMELEEEDEARMDGA
jgi:hypothetical protein